MQPIIYDVAVSIDGFICGPNGDISQFAHEGTVVDDYQERMKGYAVAIMGRSTYEFGYRFGMKAGENPYPHMTTYVYSQAIECPKNSDVTVVQTDGQSHLQNLKTTAKGPIYLCGGGKFAGSLISVGMIDLVCLKRAPIVLGEGVRLFGDHAESPQLKHVETRLYDSGYLFQEYRVEGEID